MATKKDREMTQEEKELVGLIMEEKARERNSVRFHDWGASGKTTHSWFRVIKGRVKKLAMFIRVGLHKYLKSKNSATSMFPKSEVWEAICIGSGTNTCPVCKKLEPVSTYVDELDQRGNKKRATEVGRAYNGAKFKQWRYWIGVTYDEDGEIECVEPYRLQDYYFREKFLPLIAEKKYSLAKWVKMNPELKKLKSIDKEAHWMENCPPKRALPGDPAGGYKTFCSKSGKGFDTDHTFKFEDFVPLKKGTPEYKAIKEAIDNGTFPDLEGLTIQLDYKKLDKLTGPVNPLFLNPSSQDDDDEDIVEDFDEPDADEEDAEEEDDNEEEDDDTEEEEEEDSDEEDDDDDDEDTEEDEDDDDSNEEEEEEEDTEEDNEDDTNEEDEDEGEEDDGEEDDSDEEDDEESEEDGEEETEEDDDDDEEELEAAVKAAKKKPRRKAPPKKEMPSKKKTTTKKAPPKKTRRKKGSKNDIPF